MGFGNFGRTAFRGEVLGGFGHGVSQYVEKFRGGKLIKGVPPNILGLGSTPLFGENIARLLNRKRGVLKRVFSPKGGGIPQKCVGNKGEILNHRGRRSLNQ